MAKKPTYEELKQKIKQLEKESLERGKAEAEMALFRRFTEASGQGLGMANLEGHVIYANPTLCRFMGEEGPEDPIGKPVQTYYSEEDLFKLENEILPAVFKKGQETAEIPLQSLKGELTPTIQNVFLIRNDEGEPVCLANVLTDITEHKLAERELKRYRDHLKELVAERTSDLRKTNEELQQEITERKQADESLRESEQRFKELADLLPVSVFELDMDGNFTYTNRCGFEMFGYTSEDLEKGVNALQLFIPEERQRVKQNIRKRLTGIEFEDHEYTALNMDGSTFTVLINTAVIIRDNKSVGVRGIVLDITDRKQVEEALRESEERFRAMFEHMGSGVAVYKAIENGEDFIFQGFNSSAERITRISRNAALGSRLLDLFPHMDRSGLLGALQRVWKTGQAEHLPPFYYKDEIREGWRDNRIYKLPSGEIVAIFDDVTERKQAEEALQESEAKLRSFMESATTSFSLYDSELNLVSINDKGLSFFPPGTKRYDILGRSLQELVPDLEETGRYHKYLEVIRTGTPFFVDDIVPHTKFGEKHLSITAFRAGEDLGLIVEDITDRKRAEDELKQSRQQLRDLASHLQSIREEERTQIAREIHDDLGQALTALKLDIHWLANRLTDDQALLLEKIKSMSRLVDTTVHSVQRISSELRPGLLDDLGLSTAIEWQVGQFTGRSDIKCDFTSDPEEIVLDRDLSTTIFRIFQEAMTNIARHANATRVEVSLKQKSDAIELKVTDDGKGITEKQISDPGSFGLIGIHERVHSLGGTLEISGVRDRGTRVIVSVPLDNKGQ